MALSPGVVAATMSRLRLAAAVGLGRMSRMSLGLTIYSFTQMLKPNSALTAPND